MCESSFILVLLAILVLNIPFGFWRAGVRRFSLAWFAAVHLPVPFVVCMRILAGAGWNLATLPLFLAAYFTGQFLGATLRLHGRIRPDR